MKKPNKKTYIVEQSKIAFVHARNEEEAEEKAQDLDRWDWIDQPLEIVEQQSAPAKKCHYSTGVIVNT
jgi:hypothetical protein